MQGVESVAADTSENYENTVQQWKGIFIFFIEGAILDILNTSLKI